MIASFDEITKSTTGKFPMHFCGGNCVVNDSSKDKGDFEESNNDEVDFNPCGTTT